MVFFFSRRDRRCLERGSPVVLECDLVFSRLPVVTSAGSKTGRQSKDVLVARSCCLFERMLNVNVWEGGGPGAGDRGGGGILKTLLDCITPVAAKLIRVLIVYSR